MMEKPGYRFCVSHDGHVWAGGSDGRLDWLDEPVQVLSGGEGWRCALSLDGTLWLGGEAGGLCRMQEGKAVSAEKYSGAIAALLPLEGKAAAVTVDGLFFGKMLAGEVLPPENPVVGAAQGRGRLLILTAGGSLFSSRDGEKWEHREFHRDYAGYYPACTFTALAFAGGTFFAAAVDGRGRPLLFESLYGGVWKQRPLEDMLSGTARIALRTRINGLCCEETSGQVFLLCDEGELAVMPGCPKCMRLSRPAEENLRAGLARDGRLYLVGDAFTTLTLDFDRVRQLRVGAEYAKTLLEDGALLVDLRGEREFAALSIPGSVNIPMERLEELAKIPRDRTLVFTCASGMLSPGACEKALEMGFVRVHDLGGIGEWWRQFPDGLL